jgi:catechol 2,3-dioxygenase-like lactoylglutathione lyase family enzyme
VEVQRVIVSPAGLGALTLFVEDLPRTAAFYRDVFALDPVHEDDDSTAFRLGDSVLNLLRVEAAAELIEPAPVGGASAGRRMQLTLWVEDADVAAAELKERGVELLNGPQDRPWGQRTAAFADPAGHVWEIAQTLSPDR